MANAKREWELAEEVQPAVYELALQRAGEKPAYAGTFEGKLSSIFDKIANREKFNYDVNADPLYQAAKDKHIQQGKLAMKNTMGQAAALTGGYGSSYGQQVGQQAYDAYLQDLTDVIPELYGKAYDVYKDEGDDLLKQFEMLGNMRDKEYSKYRDELSDWNYEQERAEEKERYEREWGRQAEQEEYNRQQTAEAIARQLEERDYNRRTQEEATAYAREQDEKEWAWREAQDAYNREQNDRQWAWNEDQREYERRMEEEAIARALEQQEYERGWNENERDYSREQDRLNRERQRQLDAEERDRYIDERDYSRQQDAKKDERYIEERDYDREKDAKYWEQQISESQYSRQQEAKSTLMAIIKASGYRPTDEELQEAGLSRAAADALADEFEYNRQMAELSLRSGGGYGGGGSSRSSGYYYDPDGMEIISRPEDYSSDDISRVQEFLRDQGYNIDVTGTRDLATETAAESFYNRDNSAFWSTQNDRQTTAQRTFTTSAQVQQAYANGEISFQEYQEWIRKLAGSSGRGNGGR